jgi:RNA polymerase sigma-70 factor (ECF subfamily)
MGRRNVSARLVGGEGAAEGMELQRFSELYRRFGPKVHAHCRRLLQGKQTAEDATQEIFLKLLLRSSALTPAEETWSFLRRVTTNHCLNQLRNESRRRDARLMLDARAPLPSDPVADRQLVTRIIAGVPLELSLIGWLNHVEELDQRDIAQQLSISRRTVVSRLSSFNARAKRMLCSLSIREGRPAADRVERADVDHDLSAHDGG